MVVSLGPGKFYGSSLPRPRFYSDVKINSHRVDPPVPVLDPLLSWASDAHWSMGGLSFNRLRLQGRIEGSVKRLRAQMEKQDKSFSPSPAGKAGKKRDVGLPSPPPAPIANTRRRRYVAEVEEEDSESGEEEIDEKVMVNDNSDEDESSDEEEESIPVFAPVPIVNKEKPARTARKLYEEFNRVSDKKNTGEKIPDLNRENSDDDAEDEASPKKRKQMSGSVAGIRTSPRLRSSSRRLVKRG